jgi:hypothetical protein
VSMFVGPPCFGATAVLIRETQIATSGIQLPQP